MNDELALVAELSPLAAVVIIAGVAASALAQWAKRPSWTKQRAQVVSLAIAVGLGAVAYVVAGVAGVFPASVVDAVSTGVVVVAGVAVMSRGAYSLIGYAVPDGKQVDDPPAVTARVDAAPETALTAEQAATLRRLADDNRP